MHKSVSFYIFILLITSLTFNIISPSSNASVWITPMNMLAEGNVTEGETCQVKKNIILKNDANKSAIVEISASNITVIFENNTFELLPYEEKSIHPIVLVEQGKKTGKIYIKSYEKKNTSQITGSEVVTTMAITVTTIGTLVESSSDFKINTLYLYVSILIIIGILLTVFILMKKKK